MARADFRFALAHRARYCEVDSQGIVFYGNYLAYFDNALTDYIRAMGFDPRRHPVETGCDFHVVKAEVDYARPVPLDTEIDICARVERIGRSSITFRIEVYTKGRDEVHTAGTIVWVYADQSTHKSAALPADLVARFRDFEGNRPGL